MFLCSFTAFSFTWSLFSDNIGFRVLFIGIREAAEFRDCLLIALSLFYKCMFQYKSPGHKGDNSLLFWACCFHSVNLCRTLFLFITECEFDNTQMVGTLFYGSVSDKQTIQRNHKPHIFLNTQRCCQNYIIRTCCQPVFPISSFWGQ